MNKARPQLILVLILALLLTACGGGGDKGANTPPPADDKVELLDYVITGVLTGPDGEPYWV